MNTASVKSLCEPPAMRRLTWDRVVHVSSLCLSELFEEIRRDRERDRREISVITIRYALRMPSEMRTARVAETSAASTSDSIKRTGAIPQFRHSKYPKNSSAALRNRPESMWKSTVTWDRLSNAKLERASSACGQKGPSWPWFSRCRPRHTRSRAAHRGASLTKGPVSTILEV